MHVIGFCSLPSLVPSHPQTNAECSKPRAVRYSTSCLTTGLQQNAGEVI